MRSKGGLQRAFCDVMAGEAYARAYLKLVFSDLASNQILVHLPLAIIMSVTEISKILLSRHT